MEVEPRLFRIEQQQGFGDAVALTAVLRHLRHYYQDARIELVVSSGRKCLYEGLADEVSEERDLRRPPTHLIKWELSGESYPDSPSTYVEKCLRSMFNLAPVPGLWTYRVHVCDRCKSRASQWLKSINGVSGKFAVCHFRGDSAKRAKNLDDYQAAAVVFALESAGYSVLIWDANELTTLPEEGFGRRIPSAMFGIPMQAGLVAGLLAAVDLVVGVDSGILHLALALDTPAIGLWQPPADGHAKHPVHCVCPRERSAHVMRKPPPHVVEYERFSVNRPIDDGLKFFKENYRHAWCEDFGVGISQVLGEGL